MDFKCLHILTWKLYWDYLENADPIETQQKWIYSKKSEPRKSKFDYKVGSGTKSGSDSDKEIPRRIFMEIDLRNQPYKKILATNEPQVAPIKWIPASPLLISSNITRTPTSRNANQESWDKNQVL